MFFHQGKIQLQIGDFIKAKYFTKKLNDETRLELREVQKINKENAIDKFQYNIAIVDGVNEDKALFHFVINTNLQGIVKFNETELRPKEGAFIRISTVIKFDKKQNKQRIRVLAIEPTADSSTNLRKEIVGMLKLKFKKQGVTLEYDDLDGEDIRPDFGFISDYYVSKQVLENHHITENCQVRATIIFTGDKWKIIDIKKVDN